ncbi:hypothetical protein HPB48_002845 [Haemaphysalis longicornis]|uniref:HAT C-terminal dimerisation domain-containing protein n=1 Tax=Haemaphysalis longicornis TaxID=44386 RepID=A0A9J6FEH0_HAELO|nr:hypothetical protein HPB48_002845 [Haemaphysalis longicornis]
MTCFREVDLPSPSSLKMELKERYHFQTRYQCTDRQHNIGSLIKSTDEDGFPNIKTILRIGGTLPCTSVQAESSFSALPRTMVFTRSTTTYERLADLLLIHVHRSVVNEPEGIPSEYITRIAAGCLRRSDKDLKKLPPPATHIFATV